MQGNLRSLIFWEVIAEPIGNIEKYRFSKVSLDSLKLAAQIVTSIHPNLREFDSSKFKEGIDGDFYCTIRDGEQVYIFQYSYPIYPSEDDTVAEIALTSAAKYGEDLNFAGDINFIKKMKYRKLFAKYFITEVKKRLKR
ncbi:MAG TPA: hypothetical protein VGN00_00500 [Puia sp.]|jgi:hypothetical protein